ncbi:autophagy-related protein 13-domain-containing protein [Russula earlei]|uniref:Autophagy-related protein 13-domain-containing protein n=1 Tax=Russula earlei TaxID=71964 RepID=A0ACC0UKB6_9AGAM|nr:autophagy-related protein 13-domain-containing protein [Russula earlei]
MSYEASKADQIAYRYYTKLASVVHASRATAEPNPQAKVDKWFNLETPDAETFKENLRPYRSLSATPSPLPFELQVLLSVPDLSPNQVLVCKGADSSRLRIEPIPQFILLESWSVQFSPRPDGSAGDADLGLSTVYKHGIGLFRSIYSLLRVLPTWKLHKRLRRRGAVPSNRNANLNIELRVRNVRDLDGVLGFDVPPAAQAPPFVTESHTFPSVPHPYGNITLSVRYLTSPNFHLDELESLLSSRFFSLDEGADFTPTLVRNQQRESLSSSPGSLPLRTSLPASPPSSAPSADRIARPSAQPSQHARTTSFPTSSARLPPPLQGSRAGMASDSGGVSSHSSLSSRLEVPVFPTPNTRLRRESMGSDLPSLPGPLPIRRPQLNPLNPFKASTLSSGSPSLHSPSPSLRQASPLPSRGPGPPAVSSSPRVPPSPGGHGRLSSSPIAPLKPSPPFQPGSLGDKRSLNSADGGGSGSIGGGGGDARKRYSSSFGHRYKDSLGGASEGSTGSGEKKERESDKGGSPILFSTNPDEDDLSAFVNDASQPKPLSRQYRAQNPDPVLTGQVPDRSARPSRSSSPTAATYARDSPDSGNALGLGLGLAATGPLLTSEDAVDDHLRRMNATFVASLEMLGGPRRRERAQSSPGPGLRDGEYRNLGSPGRRVERISEITEEVSGSESASANQNSRESAARAHMQSLVSRPRPGSRTDSITSEEVIGKLELDERRQSMGQ